ncbi:hypothetical protein Verru16b_01601 [Lacunisphaera limnophila]|uniref:Uncharacterized protein n=1 Tax=Lacunisphaera limnophila TaxID=1838286 RepID=A0A1D8AUI5_9BACT|nr:glycosyltransferase family 39 protein [Lacunisphaera limnophila]AOS44538.1 hypothetical protein Verru16b_01601 [Lacunisphaera limnophila]
MEFRRTALAAWLSRPESRLAALGLSAVAAVWWGFVGVGVRPAEQFLMRGGYHVMTLTFGLWLFALARLWRERGPEALAWPVRERLPALALIAVCCTVALVHENFRSKILYDEYVLQSTAFNMHYFRDVGVMVRGYDLLGTFVSLDNYLDKRPYFYPYLISLVHGLSGYRPANAIAVNVLLLPVCLGLAYWLGRGLAGWRGGLLAAGLLGTLPLLAQNATGSGMELTNLTMLLACVVLAGAWLERPDETRLTAFVLAGVLLTQCRYESALYVVAVVAVVLAGWWRARRCVVAWPVVVAPLLLMPVAWHQRVLSASPVLWEMKADQVSRFGLEYLEGNLRGVIGHLFSWNTQQANSPLLSVLGIAALLWVAAWLVWRGLRGPRAVAARHLPWLLFGAVICANTALIQFYFWGSLSDPMAARFGLPLCVLLAFAVVFLARWLDRRLPATPWLLALLAVAFLGFALPRQARHHYSNLGNDEIEWERRFVADRAPVSRLIITNKSSLPWLMEQTPSILLPRARILEDRLRLHLARRTFGEILVMQSLRPTNARGGHQLVPEEELPPGFALEFITEKRFGTKIARISRLVAVTKGGEG